MRPSVVILYSACVVSGWVGSPVQGLLLDGRRIAPLRQHRRTYGVNGRCPTILSRTASFACPIHLLEPRREGGSSSISLHTRAALPTDSGSDIESSAEGRRANDLPTNFNPFNYQRSSTASAFDPKYNAVPSSHRIVSLRKARMQEITNQLLQVASSSTANSGSLLLPDDDVGARTLGTMRSILDENRDFVLEPLESDDAVLDPDSVLYQGSAGSSSSPPLARSERYRLYRIELQERIGRAKNSASRTVLQVLHDFIQSHE